MNWPMAVENEISSVNGRVIIQSQVAAWSDPIIWGRVFFIFYFLFFGAHLGLSLGLCHKGTTQVLHFNCIFWGAFSSITSTPCSLFLFEYAVFKVINLRKGYQMHGYGGHLKSFCDERYLFSCLIRNQIKDKISNSVAWHASCSMHFWSA